MDFNCPINARKCDNNLYTEIAQNDCLLIQGVISTLFVDLMPLDIYKISDDSDPELLVFDKVKEEDLVWQELEPGSTHATKLRGIVTADESSAHVERLWTSLQLEDIRLEQEGFTVSGRNFHPQFFERFDQTH